MEVIIIRMKLTRNKIFIIIKMMKSYKLMNQIKIILLKNKNKKLMRNPWIMIKKQRNMKNIKKIYMIMKKIYHSRMKEMKINTKQTRTLKINIT